MKNLGAFLSILLAAQLSASAASTSASFKITSNILDAGGARLTASASKLLGKLRQHSLAVPANDNFLIGAGFLRTIFRLLAPPAVPPELIPITPVESSKNPFNPSQGPTTFSYSLSQDSAITVYIYNLRGERIWQYDAPAGTPGGSAGQNQVVWDGVTGFKTVAGAGVYIVHLVAKVDGQPKIISTTKVAIIK